MSCNCGKSWEKYLPWNAEKLRKSKQGKVDPEKEMEKKLKKKENDEK